MEILLAVAETLKTTTYNKLAHAGNSCMLLLKLILLPAGLRLDLGGVIVERHEANFDSPGVTVVLSFFPIYNKSLLSR